MTLHPCAGRCLANANTDNASKSYDEMVALLGRPQFHAWLVFLACVLALSAIHLRCTPSGAPAGAILYPLLAGGLGGMTTLLAKSLGELGKV